jgi:DNA mismatch repair protein MutL
VSFKLLHQGRAVLDLPKTDAYDRMLEGWPDEFREQRLPIDLRDAEITLRGVVGLPELARPTPKYQHLYLNGRPIRDKFIQHAVREAYRGLTEPGRHPAAILLIDMSPQDVDVNVHPTKAEVRFRDSSRIHGLVMSALREVLLGSDLAPQAVPRGGSDEATPFRADMREKLATFFRAMPSEVAAPTFSDQPHPSSLSLHVQPAPQPVIDFRSRNIEAPIVAPNASSGVSQDDPGLASGATKEPVNVAQAVSPQTPAIQLHNSYLVAQSDDGMIIIDQHALHERIMYEELHARLTRGPLESQRLLIPQTIPASSRQIALLEQIQPLLARLGIEASAFGPNTVAVQAFPSFLDRLEPGKFVSELLERGEQELLDMHEEELLHEILDMMACKAAVKAGDPLSPAEIEALLARRELVDRSSNCPHGRPTTLRLSLRDLEKQFKRTGF